MTNENNKETSNVGVEIIVRSMILSHFIKGNMSFYSYGNHIDHFKWIGILGVSY